MTIGIILSFSKMLHGKSMDNIGFKIFHVYGEYCRLSVEHKYKDFDIFRLFMVLFMVLFII